MLFQIKIERSMVNDSRMIKRRESVEVFYQFWYLFFLNSKSLDSEDLTSSLLEASVHNSIGTLSEFFQQFVLLRKPILETNIFICFRAFYGSPFFFRLFRSVLFSLLNSIPDFMILIQNIKFSHRFTNLAYPFFSRLS
jgi:hypothetical protein